jgi:hypothetical protein
MLCFQLVRDRHERRSVIITTNLVFSDRTRIFKGPMTRMAAIDRVVHHSVILDLMRLESYRAQEASGHHPRAGPPPPSDPDQERGPDEPLRARRPRPAILIAATGKSS